MRKVIAIIVAIILLLGSTAIAFDGKREGFIIGGGLGFAPSMKVDNGIFETNDPGGAANFMIGFAWDKQNMLVWEGNMAGSEKDGKDTFQGVSVIALYHYFKPTKQTFFAVGGLGLYHYEKTGSFGWWGITEHDSKAGYLLGGGFQFRPHWQLGLYFSFGETEYEGVVHKHTNVSLLINVIAF